MNKNNKNKFTKLWSKLSKKDMNNINNLMDNNCTIKAKKNLKTSILWLVATFLTFILEFEAIYVIQGNINGWIGLSVIVFFVLPIVFNNLLAQQYKGIGKGIVYGILKALQKISWLSPILLLTSLLLYLITQQELVMLVIASISVMLPIIIVTVDIVIVSLFDMYNKEKPKTI